MPIVNVNGFGMVKFPDSMSPDDIKSALDTKFSKAAPFKGALQGVEQGAGKVAEGLGTAQELLTPKIQLTGQRAPATLADLDKSDFGGAMTRGAGGQTVENRTPVAEAPHYERVGKTPSEIVAGLPDNPLYQAGKVAAESVPLTGQQQASKWTQAGQQVGGAAQMALGPLATGAFALQSMGDVKEDYDRIKQEQPDISHDEASSKALDTALMKGQITAGVFTALPPAIRGPLEKYVVGKFGQSALAHFLSGRASSATETAAIMGAQTAGQEAAEGKAPDREVLKSAGAGAVMGLLLPWLKKGSYKNAIQKRIAAKVGAQPVGAKSPGQGGGQGVGPGQQGQTPAGTGEAPRQAESALPLKSSLFSLEHSEDGKWHVINPGNEIESSHDSREAAEFAMKKLEGQAQPSEKAKNENLIHPDHQAVLDEAAPSVKHPVELADVNDPNNPFARGQNSELIATIVRPTKKNPKGKIVINPRVYDREMAATKPEDRGKLTRSILAEEQHHLAISDTFAETFYKNLSKLERKIYDHIYSGGQKLTGMNDTLRGHEALNFVFKRLARMDQSQMIDVTRKEKWKLKTLFILADGIRGIRESIGTKASKENMAILDHMRRNVEAGIAEMSGGSKPGAMSSKPVDEKDVDGMSHDELLKLKHGDGIRYGLTQGPGDVERLQKKYDEASKLMSDSVTLDDGGKTFQSTFGKLNFYGGALMGATRGEHPISGGNYELFLKQHPELAPAEQPGARPKHRPVSREQEDFLLPGMNTVKTAVGKAREVEQVPGEGFKFKPTAAVPQDERKTAEASGALPRPTAAQTQDIATKWLTGDKNPEKPKPGLIEQMVAKAEKNEPLTMPTAKEFGEMLKKSGGGHLQKGAVNDLFQGTIGKVIEKLPGEQLRLLGRGVFKGRPPEILTDAEMKQEAGGDEEKYQKLKEIQERRQTKQAGRTKDIWQGAVPDKDEGADVVRKFSDLEKDLAQKMEENKQAEDEARELKKEFDSFVGGAQEKAELSVRLQDARTNVWDTRKYAQDARRRVAELKPEYDGVVAKRKRRAWIMSALFRKAMKTSAVENDAPLLRKEVTPEDIRLGGGEGHGSYEDTTGLPDSKVDESLKDSARMHNRAANITRRLAVLVHKLTGRTYLVSAYDHPHGPDVPSDIRVLDPVSPTREHVPVERIRSRYKIIRSVLLDEPVRKFKQEFDSVKDYNEEFGNEAEKMSRHAAAYMPGSLTEEEFMAETPGRIEGGSGGSFQGPARDLIAEGEGGAMEKSETTPLKDAEAQSLLDHVLAEGVPKSMADVHDALAKLPQTGTRQAISAVAKLGRALQAKNPDASGPQLMDLLSQRIFQAHRDAGNISDFTKRLMSEARTPQGLTPGARASRYKEKMEDVTVKAMGSVRAATAGYLAAPNRDKLATSLDVADNISNNEGERSDQYVRMQSSSKKKMRGDEKILSAANAYIAAGGLQTRYKMDEEALAYDEQIRKEDPVISKSIDYLKHLKKQSAIAKNMGKDTAAMDQEIQSVSADIEKGVLKHLIEEGKVDHQGVSYIHSDTPPGKLDELIARVKLGSEEAQRWMGRKNYIDRFVGRRWLKNNQKLIDELEFAKAHWNNPDLRATAEAARHELDLQYDIERQNGRHIEFSPAYTPERYNGELVSRNSVLFGGVHLLGRNFASAKVFPSAYHAAEKGPYVSATRDLAAVVGSRVRSGMRMLNKSIWWDNLRNIKDLETKQPIAREGKVVKGKTVAPSPDYVEYKTPSGDLTYVLRSYEGIVNQLTRPSAFQDWALTRGAIEAGQFLKHTALVGDLFHLGRVTYYGAAIAGRKVGYKGGWTALNFREKDLDQAVARGIVEPSTANWLKEKVPFNNKGHLSTKSRFELAQEIQLQGLNVGQISDAIYKDLVRNVPLFGRYNKFLFDRYTRGMMMGSAIKEYERLARKDPSADSRTIMRDISKDLNPFFGSIGRQGWVKSATFQDLNRLIFLAPNWQEGLIKKELSVLRGVTQPVKSWTGRGVAFRGVMRGLAAMFVLTQVANMISRRQPTWKNKEKEHMWDAEVGNNVWLSPLSVYNELTGDLLRLNETKPRAWDAIQQIGENKLGFWGRAAMVLMTGKSGSGETPSTTGGLLKSAAGQLAPSPISFGPLSREVGHAIAPGTIAPNPPGKLSQSVMSSSGFKTHRGMDAEQAMKLSAQKFKDSLGRSSPKMEYSDDPSYAQLRYFLKVGDTAAASKMFEALKKTRPEQKIVQAMNKWARAPFTGSRAMDRLWIAGMDDDERSRYTEAVRQKHEELDKFRQWYLNSSPK